MQGPWRCLLYHNKKHESITEVRFWKPKLNNSKSDPTFKNTWQNQKQKLLQHGVGNGPVCLQTTRIHSVLCQLASRDDCVAGREQKYVLPSHSPHTSRQIGPDPWEYESIPLWEGLWRTGMLTDGSIRHQVSRAGLRRVSNHNDSTWH